MTCQHKDKKTATEESSGGTWQDYSYYETCGKPAPNYRQCGRGGSICKVEFGFCAAHGGDAKARELMQAHHKENHPRDTDV